MLISTGLINREEEDKILNLALLTGEHVLLVGPPGTGKTLQADLFFRQLEGKYFKTSLSKFSTEEAVFGPLNISALRQGRYEYCCENTLLDAHYALIDEMFDASDALLRSMLSVLNERQFNRGSFSIRCPLITVVATANYTRISEITMAVVDRFLFQWQIRLLEEKELINLFDWRVPEPQRKISLSEIEAAQNAVDMVYFPPHLREVYVKLCVSFNFSTRRVFKSIRVIKAHALMSDRQHVIADDLLALKYLVSPDAQRIADATKVIADAAIVAQRAHEQSILLDSLEDRWNLYRGHLDDMTHLQREAEIIRNVKGIQPANDEVARRKTRLLEEWDRHYKRSLSEYLKARGLDA